MDELQIIKYLDGEMSEEEKGRFEEQIRMNRELEEELEKYRQVQAFAMQLLSGEAEGRDTEPFETDAELEREVRDSVREFREDPASRDRVPDDFREKVTAAWSKLHAEKENRGVLRQPGRTWYYAAALLILAAVLYVLFFGPARELSAEEIYSQYFKPLDQTEQITDIARSDNDFLFAVSVYEAGDYQRASILFDLLAEKPETRSWSLLYAASACMYLHQSDRAIELLKELDTAAEREVSELASWQLALIYIKTGNTDRARTLLEGLEEDSGFSRESRQILRILERD